MTAVLTNISWRDSRGKIAHTKYFVHTGTVANQDSQSAAIAAALVPLSNAFQQSILGAHTRAPVGATYGAQATYQGAEDKAVFTFQTTTGSIHRMEVPAPVLGLFLGDGETVNPANADFVTFLTAFAGIGTDSFGNPLNTFVGGIRKRRKLQRKETIFWLTPIFGPEE